MAVVTWVRGTLCLAAALVDAGPARAAIVESVEIANSYRGVHYAGLPPLDAGGTSHKETGPGVWTSLGGDVVNRAEYGIDYVGEVDEQSGSFFFLHNNYCVGTCGTASRTVITFTIRNDGETEEALRFDSLITPGHLARIGSSGSSEAGFEFTVTQDPDTGGAELYRAAGVVSDAGISVTTPNSLALNGLRQLQAGGWTVLDWGATNLNLNLGMLGAGQTTVVRYEAKYYSRTSGTCLDLSNCAGVQVVFGDPRKNGSGMDLMFMAALADEPTRDVIDPLYHRYATSFAVVKADAALPDDPDPMPELSYDRTFTPEGQVVEAAVPENGTWGMMLLGAGLIGSVLRRRRVPALHAHGA